MNLQLQITARFTNIHPTDAITTSMYIVILSEGVCSILNGRMTTQVGIISHLETLNAPAGQVVHSTGEGGNFLTSVKNIIRAIPPLVSKVLPAIETGAKVGRLFGLGNEDGNEYEEAGDELDMGENPLMEGEGRRRRKAGRPKKRKGRGLVGGELVSRSQLRDNLY